jgi:hypothetical protein
MYFIDTGSDKNPTIYQEAVANKQTKKYKKLFYFLLINIMPFFNYLF